MKSGPSAGDEPGNHANLILFAWTWLSMSTVDFHWATSPGSRAVREQAPGLHARHHQCRNERCGGSGHASYWEGRRAQEGRMVCALQVDLARDWPGRPTSGAGLWRYRTPRRP